MAISAAFLVNGNPNPAAHSVAYGASVTLTLLSTSGANSIVWEFLGSSNPDVVYPTLVPSGTPTGQTCTFSMIANPGGTLGRSLLLRCTVRDSAGNTSRQTAVIGVLNGAGLVPIPAGEELERSATHGWAVALNAALNGGGAPSGAAGGDLSGTYPNPTIAAGVIVNADVSASAAIAGTKISPSFGSQNISTTGSLSVTAGITNLGASALGTNPASSGLVRLPNAGDIVSRNAANNGNVSLIYLSGSDGVIVGGSSAASVSLLTSASSLVLGTNAEFTCGQIRFDNSVASPSFIQEDVSTASTNGQVLLITAQNATGTTSTGGELRLRSGTGTTASGALRLYAGANNQVSIFDTGIDVNTPQLGYASSVSSPTFGQNTLSTASATGQVLMIRAQNCSGATSTGGILDLRSGTGTSTDGNLNLRTGSTLRLQITPNVISMSNPTLRFDAAQATPAITQETDATNSVTGDTLTISAQACSGTTSTGGSLDLRSGTGTSAAGSITLRRGSTTVFEANASNVLVGDTAGATHMEVATFSGRDIVALAFGSALTTTQMPTNTGNRVLFIGNASAVPSANSVGGGILYCESGALKYRGTSGTVTTLGAA